MHVHWVKRLYGIQSLVTSGPGAQGSQAHHDKEYPSLVPASVFLPRHQQSHEEPARPLVSSDPKHERHLAQEVAPERVRLLGTPGMDHLDGIGSSSALAEDDAAGRAFAE